MHPTTLPWFATCALIALSFCSCALEKSGTRPEPTRFLQSTGIDVSHRIDRLPFEHAWRDPSVDLTKYKHIVVRPVTTTYLRTESWENSKSTLIPNKQAYQKRCSSLARYWSKSLDKAFSSPVCMFYKTTDTSKPGTLILEVALTEVTFQQAPTSAANDNGPADGVLSAVTGAPLCAFEARTRDAATGKLISTSADRRGPEIRVMSSQKTSLTQLNEAICDEWSQQLMQRSNQELFPTVKRSWFSLF
jgi:hypothetical protein